MFLKRRRRKEKGEVYESWSLVQTVRTERGPRHRTVAHLGKTPGLDSKTKRRWEDIGDLLEGRDPSSRQLELDEAGEGGEAEEGPQWTEVDIKGLRIEQVREFGQVYLALALWRRLGLHKLLGEIIEEGREWVGWEVVACILTIARFCGNKSELEVAERWYRDSALEDLLGVSWKSVNLILR